MSGGVPFDCLQPDFQTQGNFYALKRLSELLGTGKAISFVGAGASKPLYPLWPELIERLAQEARRMGLASAGQVNAWTEDGAALPQGVAHTIREHVTREQFASLLADEFRPKQMPGGEEYTPTHAALLRMPFRGHVTTNYDPGLATARMAIRGCGAFGVGGWADKDMVGWWLDGQIFERYLYPVYYMHGKADSPSSMVLTADDYSATYDASVLPRKLFESLWTREHLVFVGFGFSDETLLTMVDALMEECVRGRASPPQHIAIVGIESLDEGEQELRRAYMQRHHAYPLFYPVVGADHSALSRILGVFGESVLVPLAVDQYGI